MRTGIVNSLTTLVAAGLIVVSFGCKPKPKAADLEEKTAADVAVENVTAPEAAAFSLPDLNGASVSLAGFKGKGVIVDFWATWCPPCVKEVPHFAELHDAYKDKGIVILGVSLDDTKEDIAKFLEEQKVPYPILHADKLTLSKVTNDYGGIQFIPTTFFISPDGHIIEKLEGYHTKAELEQNIAKILPNS